MRTHCQVGPVSLNQISQAVQQPAPLGRVHAAPGRAQLECGPGSLHCSVHVCLENTHPGTSGLLRSNLLQIPPDPLPNAPTGAPVDTGGDTASNSSSQPRRALSTRFKMSSWAPLQLHGLREAEKGYGCIRMLKISVTNLGEGSNFSGLGWGKPSRRGPFSVTFYNPIILSKSSIS